MTPWFTLTHISTAAAIDLGANLTDVCELAKYGLFDADKAAENLAIDLGLARFIAGRDVALAGGAIIGAMKGQLPSDLDFFMPESIDMYEYAQAFPGAKFEVSGNIVTVFRPDYVPAQFIATGQSIEDTIGGFDMSHLRAYYKNSTMFIRNDAAAAWITRTTKLSANISVLRATKARAAGFKLALGKFKVETFGIAPCETPCVYCTKGELTTQCPLLIASESQSTTVSFSSGYNKREITLVELSQLHLTHSKTVCFGKEANTRFFFGRIEAAYLRVLAIAQKFGLQTDCSRRYVNLLLTLLMLTLQLSIFFQNL